MSRIVVTPIGTDLLNVAKGADFILIGCNIRVHRRTRSYPSAPFGRWGKGSKDTVGEFINPAFLC
jgi:hypothetical protein